MLELHTVTTLSIHVPGVDISSRSLAPSILIARTIIGGGSGCDQAAGGGALQRRPTTTTTHKICPIDGIWRLFHRGGNKLVPR